MKAFLDTSVLVATSCGDHQLHNPSIELFLRHSRSEACRAADSLAEVYASLTGMPGKYRTAADDAMLFLLNIRERLTLVTLTDAEFFKAVEASASASVLGGSIYDAVPAHCALKANAARIYTWNVKLQASGRSRAQASCHSAAGRMGNNPVARQGEPACAIVGTITRPSNQRLPNAERWLSGRKQRFAKPS